MLNLGLGRKRRIWRNRAKGQKTSACNVPKTARQFNQPEPVISLVRSKLTPLQVLAVYLVKKSPKHQHFNSCYFLCGFDSRLEPSVWSVMMKEPFLLARGP